MPFYEEYEDPNVKVEYFSNESDFSFETPILPQN